MNTTNKTFVLALTAAFVLMAMPQVNAQTSEDFGSMVEIGDSDFIPALGATPAAMNFCRVALGDTSLVTDDGYYLYSRADGAAPNAVTLPVNAVRLTSVGGKAAGTLTGDADTSEVGKTCADPDGAGAGVASASSVPVGFGALGAAVANVYFLNFDQVTGYTSGDCVYLDSGASGSLGTVSRWDIRLTDCTIGSTNYNAGTLVELGDVDLQNAPAAAVLGAAAVWKYWDSQPNGVFDSGDRLYASSVAIATANKPVVNDVRVLGGAGEFGSMVEFGDSDFVPTLVAPPGGAMWYCQVALGDTSLVTDDGYYIASGAPAATLPVNAIRIAPVVGKAVGTLTGDSDTTEVGKTCATTVAVGFAAAAGDIYALSFDQIATFTSGDCLYLARAASATAARWDIRLTDCTIGSTTYNAGTLVELGDLDLQNAPAKLAPAGAAFGFWDSQPNTFLDNGDRLYFTQGTGQPGINNVRLLGATGDFGSMVEIGDNDFLPTLTATPLANDVYCQVALGDTSLVTDDGFYVFNTATAPGAQTLPVNAIRLTSVVGKAAGTMTGDADTTEVGKACVGGAFASAFSTAATTGDVYWVNFDQVGTFTAGDCVYIRTGLGGAAAGAMGRWDIRATDCVIGSTTYNAGSLVELGDLDLQNSPGASAWAVAAAWKFFDSQPNGALDSGDLLYASSLPLGTTANPAINDVRLFGDASAITGPGTPTATEPTPTATEPTPTATEPTPTATEPTPTATEPTPTATEPTTPTEPTPETNPTPGFELIALVAVLGAALVLVRRRN